MYKRQHLGSYAITTVGKIANQEDLIREAYEKGHIHFLEMSGGKINATELVAAIINQAESIVDGLLLAQEKIIGSDVYKRPSRNPVGRQTAFVRFSSCPVGIFRLLCCG